MTDRKLRGACPGTRPAIRPAIHRIPQRGNAAAVAAVNGAR
jgi:hypothetical protein